MKKILLFCCLVLVISQSFGDFNNTNPDAIAKDKYKNYTISQLIEEKARLKREIERCSKEIEQAEEIKNEAVASKKKAEENIKHDILAKGEAEKEFTKAKEDVEEVTRSIIENSKAITELENRASAKRKTSKHKAL